MQKMGQFGGSQVIGNVTIRQSTYNFLFDFNRNHAPILYRFRDIAGYLSKVADFDSPHLYLAPPQQVTLVEFRRDLWHQETRVPGVSCGVVCVILRFAVLVEHRLVTDGHRQTQTDRQTQAHGQYRGCIASRGKNAISLVKPSVSKTVCSVFKVYNASSGCDLKVSVNGQPLRHKPHPVYFNVTLDRTINYKQQLTKIADNVKSCNNLLMKLTNSSLGANSNTLWSSTLALCYSAGEYCCPVWAHTSHRDLTDVQLNSVMRIINGTLCSSPLPRLPDL